SCATVPTLAPTAPTIRNVAMRALGVRQIMRSSRIFDVVLRRSPIADLETQSPTLATTVVRPAYLVLRVLIRTLAVGPDEGVFWPVISNSSVTTWTPQFLTLEKVAPRLSSSSSTRKGTTLVRPICRISRHAGRWPRRCRGNSAGAHRDRRSARMVGAQRGTLV